MKEKNRKLIELRISSTDKKCMRCGFFEEITIGMSDSKKEFCRKNRFLTSRGFVCNFYK